MNQPKPRLRFRLRTLFLLVLVLALPFGAWRAWFQPYRVQKEAIVAICKAGGYGKYKATGPAWLRSIFGDVRFLEAFGMNVATGDDAEVVECIFRLPALRILHVSGLAFTDEHLARLSRLQHLREVVLTGTSVSPERVEALERARGDVAIWIGLSFEELAKATPGTPWNTDNVRQAGVPASVRQWVGKRVQLDGQPYYANELAGRVTGCEMGPEWVRVPPGRGVAIVLRSAADRDDWVRWVESNHDTWAEGILDMSRDLSDQTKSVYRLSDATMSVGDKMTVRLDERDEFYWGRERSE